MTPALRRGAPSHKAKNQNKVQLPTYSYVSFKMEVTPKGKTRMTLDEVRLYTVQNGKIVEERFFMGGPQS